MSRWSDHLIILPIILPLVAGAFLLLLDERRRTLKATISVVSALAVLGVSVALLRVSAVAESGPIASLIAVYRLGDWPAPFAIVLVLDRLSALMLMLTSVLGFACLIFSLARWQRVGSHFHSLFQFLIVGLNGAFLTGDLFNLFVFFEILLTASYGLVLHGSGRARVQAGLHYIAVNLGASSLFLIGVSLIYGVTGTLNMADIAMRVPVVSAGDRMLLEAGGAVLGVAFLVKAGMWPLSFWLPSAYSTAAPPIAAFFAIMTKVGVYIILRLSLLIFGPEAGASAEFGGTLLIAGGMMTVIFGSIGILASQDLARLASYSVLISSGTLLAFAGVGDPVITGGALFYLVNSTLAIGALFMLVELIERGRPAGADVLAVTMEAYGEDEEEAEQEEEVRVITPATMAILGVSFLACAVLIAGLPPLSGFLAKFLLLKALLQLPDGLGKGEAVMMVAWILIALLLLSGLAAVIAMARAGIRSFWLPLERTLPQVRVIEIAPIVGLLLVCAALTVQADPVMRFLVPAAESLHMPKDYIRSVLPDPGPAAQGSGK